MTYQQHLTKINNAHGERKTFQDFVTLVFCALTRGRYEDLYQTTIKGYSREDLDLFAAAFASLVQDMEKTPYTDLLSNQYVALKGKKELDYHGQFMTPKPVADLMARILWEDKITELLESPKPIKILEPAVGGGQTVLSLFQIIREAEIPFSRFRVIAIDIDRTMFEIAFINFTLWGIPTLAIHGDALNMRVVRHTVKKQVPVPGKIQMDLFNPIPTQEIEVEELEEQYIWDKATNLFWR